MNSTTRDWTTRNSPGLIRSGLGKRVIRAFHAYDAGLTTWDWYTMKLAKIAQFGAFLTTLEGVRG